MSRQDVSQAPKRAFEAWDREICREENLDYVTRCAPKPAQAARE